jgi:hypothetical protein
MIKIDKNSNFIKYDYLEYFCVENVITYEYANFSEIHIKTSEIVNSELKNMYFIIDTPFNESFGHWVFESAIYLEIFKKLKRIYPQLILVIGEKKDFKILFLKYFEINDFQYEIDKSFHNICLFPKPISCLNNKEICDQYKFYVNHLFHNFPEEIKIHDIVLLPRQTKENFKYNDRTYDLKSIEYEFMVQNKKILNTDAIKHLSEQVKIIKSARIIIVTDGSPFLVNGMFAKNSIIILVGNLSVGQIAEYNKMEYIYSCISKNNKIIRVNSNFLQYHQLQNILSTCE